MKKEYKTFGIIGMILIIISLIKLNYFFILELPNPFFKMDINITGILSLYSFYEKYLMIFSYILGNAICIWGLVISIKLIKTNKHTKQLIYFIFVLGGIEFLKFILYIPLNQFLITNLLLGIFIYAIGIYHNNFFSRLIFGKNE